MEKKQANDIGREPFWLQAAKELQALSQDGLTYTKNPYEKERFERIRQIAVEMMHCQTDFDKTRITTLFASEKGYQTPKMEVRACIIHKERILLVQERVDGRWTMPGGWAEPGYSLAENLVKEAKEEAGVDIEPNRIVAVYDRRKVNAPPSAYPIYKIVVDCRYIKGSYRDNLETADARFFDPDALPDLSTPRINEDQIRYCFQVHGKPQHEAWFD